MPKRLLILVPAVLLTVAGIAVMHTSADAPPVEPLSTLSAEQKAAALDFSKEHHPQLNSLIRRLEKRNPAEYEKALLDVSRTCERLARLQPRDPERYQVDLDLWKVDSRIRLLAARMANDQRSTLEQQLRSLLNERTDLRLQQLALDRDRLASRIDRIDSQISQLSGDRDALVDKEVERLRKSVRNRTSAVSKQRPPAPQSQPTESQPAGKAEPPGSKKTPAPKTSDKSRA